MKAVFCGTPYQIIIALQLKNSLLRNEKVVLFVYNHFAGFEDIVERIRENNIFESVFVLDNRAFTSKLSKNRIFRYFQKSHMMLNSSKYVRKYFPSQFFEELYFAYPSLLLELFILHSRKLGHDLKCHLFEDGTGAYTRRIHKPTKMKLVFKQLVGKSKYLDNYDSLMVFEPSLMLDKNANIVALPKVSNSDKGMKNLLYSIFQFKQDFRIQESKIFFEQPFDHSNDLNDFQYELIHKLALDDLIIKLHPRTKSKLFLNENFYLYQQVPWELIALDSDIQNKTLISIFSTAAFSAKIIFGQEPKLVFLHELPEVKKIHQIHRDYILLLKKFQTMYTNPTHIFIPKSLEELNQFFSDL
mgnify:CR=1 FL=1